MSSSANKVTRETVRAGVIGWPVEHSRSPHVHGYWLQKYGIDGQYERFAVAPPDLAEFLASLGDKGLVGVNVTLPHKEAAFQLVDSADPLARQLEAVNTIVLSREGKLLGSNTDGFGFLENLRHEAPGWQPAKSVATVLGAGGAARAVIAALISEGWNEVRISNRTLKRADKIAERFGKRVSVIAWEDRSAALIGTELLVNATSLGMKGGGALEVDLAGLPENALVNDIVYDPLKTDLLASAEQRGLEIVDGLGMLLHQARPGFAAWFGIDPEVTKAQKKYVLEAGD